MTATASVPLATLLEALERAETALTKASAEGIAHVSKLLEGAQELTARAGDLRRLTALAEEWEAEAGDDLPDGPVVHVAGCAARAGSRP